MSNPYAMTRPCDQCPFRRDTPTKLRAGRIRELADNMLSSAGGEFDCHKTLDYSQVDESDGTAGRKPTTQHCAGALIFALKGDNETQLMRIASRLGMFDPERLMSDEAVKNLVCDDLDELLHVHRSDSALRQG